MAGTKLYPLNTLKDINPTAYAFWVRKYQGREQLMKREIPLLNCLWNDVLFMAAVVPQELIGSYNKVFGAGKRVHFYRIPLSHLDPSNMAVFTEYGPAAPPEFRRFYKEDLCRYTEIPQRTTDYWQREKAKGNTSAFLWGYVPHILYKGTIDVSSFEIT